MNRVEIKNKAKQMYKNNKWYIWKPLIIIGLAIGLISGITFGIESALGWTTVQTIELMGTKTTYTTGGVLSGIVGMFTSFASCALSVAYAMYVISFVRGKKLELSDVLDFMKKNWVIAFIVSLLVSLIEFVGTILLIIPGIIASIGLIFYQEVCADNPKMKATDIIRKSWEMTKGHKMDLFVMGLSFLGWIILAGLTFGIGYIWIMPYMLVSYTLAYEELKK